MSFYTRGIHFWIMFAPLLIPIGIFVIWHFRKNWQKSSPDQAFKFAVIITGGLWVFSFILGWIGSRLTDWGTRLLQGSGSLSGSVLGEKLVTMGGLYANLQGSSDSSSLLLNALVRRMASPGTWLTLFLLILFIWAGLSIYKKAYSHNDVEQKPKKEKTLYAFVLVMMLIGAGLTMVPEFIYLRDQFGSRMNTIFKFYFQTWIFWSLAAAFAVVVLFRSLSRIANWVFRIGINILLLLSLAYPFWGLWTKTDHFNFSKMTLDGNAYISQYNPGDWQAMEWLQKAPFGIIVEAVGGSYSAYGRFATQSGLPNVLGWPGHEGQWRGGWYDILSSREKDIETLYRTTDWLEAESVIEKYHIRYVIVSSYELSTYRPSLVKFDNFLKVAYQNDW